MSHTTVQRYFHISQSVQSPSLLVGLVIEGVEISDVFRSSNSSSTVMNDLKVIKKFLMKVVSTQCGSIADTETT